MQIPPALECKITAEIVANVLGPEQCITPVKPGYIQGGYTVTVRKLDLAEGSIREPGKYTGRLLQVFVTSSGTSGEKKNLFVKVIGGNKEGSRLPVAKLPLLST